MNMNDFAKMDLFFVVTTVVVLALGILVTLILFRVWRILGYVEEISGMISEEGKLLRTDVARLRSRVEREGLRMRFIGHFFRDIGKRYFARRSTKK